MRWYNPKNHVVKVITWFKSVQWKKYITWNYVCLFIYSANVIVNVLREEYSVAAAYFVAVVLCLIIWLKDRSLDQAQELIKEQGKLIDTMLGFISEVDEHNKRNNPMNKN